MPASIRPVLLACAAAASLLLVSACERASSPSEPTRDTGRFGDAYELVTNEQPDAPEELPVVVSDSLYLQVEYPGGCEDHDFDLDYEVESDTARIWLRHDNGGDNCEAMVYDRLAFEIPGRALESETILLLNPNHETPFVLKY